MLALASMAGVAVAQEVVATIDYSKLREYPYGEQGFTTVIENGALVLTDGHDWPQCTIIADVNVESDTDYTVTVCMKGDKKGAAALVVGNWADNDWKNSANPISFDTKWAPCSTVITTGTCTEPVMFRFQPNNYADVMEIAWVVVSKGDAEPAYTPLMPVNLDNAEEVAYVNFSELDSYPYDGDSAELVDGVVVNSGDDIFNVMEGLKLEPELDYGIVARVKASADVEVSVSMGDWGAVTDGSFNAYDSWNQVVVRLGLAPVDDEGNFPEENFVMFAPEDGFDGTIEVEWVKLVYFVPEPEEPEVKYEYNWKYVIDDLTGDNGESDHVWSRTGEVNAWTDAIAPVCANPAGEGQVFYADVPAHPLVEEGEEDPIPDHHVQFFVQYPDDMFKVGDIMKVSFDYYSTVERRVDTQSHFTPGDYILWHFIGTFTAKPEWQTFTAEVEITDEMVGSHDAQGCIAFNLCTKEDNEGKPESIFYMNHITIEKGELVEVIGPQLEWQSIITNGDANNGSSENVLARVDGNDDEAPVVDNPDGSGKVFEAPIVAHPLRGEDGDDVNDWDSQLFIKFNKALEEGTNIKVSFDYYCSDEREIQTQAHGAPGNYHHWQFLGNLDAKPEWQSLEWSGTISADQAGADGCQAIAFNLSTAVEAGTFYINNIVVEAELPSTGENGVEQIENVPAAVKVVFPGVYNMMGVKVADSVDADAVNALPRGIYIVNGKKMVIGR